MRATYSYLYRVKSSKNYFFRIRSGIFKKICFNSPAGGHFVASLRTDKLDEALWLATFIRRHIMEDLKMMTMRISEIQLRAMNKARELEELCLLELQVKTFIKHSFTYWLESGKKMIQLGVMSPEALSSLRTVPEQTIQAVFDEQLAADIPATVHQDTMQAFEAASARLGGKIVPRRDEALMLNRLIAEFQKIARKHERFDPELVSTSPSYDVHEGLDGVMLMATLKNFSASIRRAERQIETTRSKNLQLATCIKQFCAGKFQEVDRSAQKQYDTTFKVLRELLGDDMLVTQIDRERALSVRAHFQSLPSGRIQRGEATTLSVKSVNKYVSNSHALFQWLIDTKKCIRDNPFSGMMLKLRKILHQNKRRQFTENEISSILSYQIRSNREARTFRDAADWIPTIALYSGMRLNEISALHVRDVHQIDGIWVFNIQNHRVKNEGSRRIVPVHSALIARGLLDFVATQAAAKQLVLFPELQTQQRVTSRDGLGEPVSKWFNRTVLPNIGTDKQFERDHNLLVDFHCTRTTVACTFKRHGVSSYQVKALLGHVDDDITFGDYAGTESVRLDVLQRVIELLKYLS